MATISSLAKAGSTYLTGGAGADMIFTGSGNPSDIFGRKNNDFNQYGAGNQLEIQEAFGDAGNDRLFGGENNDYLHGGGDNDELQGGDGQDRLYGEAGDDILFGQGGAELS